MKLIILIFLVFLALFLINKKATYQKETYKIQTPEEINILNDKVCIILTCTVIVGDNIRMLAQKDKDERKYTYISSIKKWLENTQFKIIVVDNSGYSFPELDDYLIRYKNRFEIISYLEDNLPENDYNTLKNDPSKGTHEIYAINYAYDNSNLIKDCEFIIKITGRYYIPNFIKYLKYPFDDFVHQNNIERKDIQRCEVIGCKKELFKYLFNTNLDYINNEYFNDMIEVIYKRRIDKLNKNNLESVLIEVF
jgi:hypothetical protein